jgi:hypothetical protein
MTGKEAEQTLGVIRTLMERSTCYTHLSGHAGIAAGALTLLGCALRVWAHTPFLLTWMGVLVAACATTVYFTARLARANEEPLWTRQSRTVFLALLPALAGALVLTAVLWRAGEEALLPGVWMLLWGVGALAMSFFTPRVISLLGTTFMVAGAFTLFFSPGNDALTMGMTFGLIHLAYGFVLTLMRHPARPDRSGGIDPAAQPVSWP